MFKTYKLKLIIFIMFIILFNSCVVSSGQELEWLLVSLGDSNSRGFGVSTVKIPMFQYMQTM